MLSRFPTFSPQNIKGDMLLRAYLPYLFSYISMFEGDVSYKIEVLMFQTLVTSYHLISYTFLIFASLTFLRGYRRPGEYSDLEFRDSSSDGSSDYEHDRNCTGYSREQRSYNHPTGEVLQRVERLSLRDQNIALQEEFSSDEGESGKAQDFLLFEYLERDPPFGREPLANKVGTAPCLQNSF